MTERIKAQTKSNFDYRQASLAPWCCCLCKFLLYPLAWHYFPSTKKSLQPQNQICLVMTSFYWENCSIPRCLRDPLIFFHLNGFAMQGTIYLDPELCFGAVYWRQMNYLYWFHSEVLLFFCLSFLKISFSVFGNLGF